MEHKMEKSETPIGKFACILGVNEWEPTERLFAAWKTWACAAGIAAGDQSALTQAIHKKLGVKVKGCTRRDFGKPKKALNGIALIKDQSDDYQNRRQ
jgi:hypothetical protein